VRSIAVDVNRVLTSRDDTAPVGGERVRRTSIDRADRPPPTPHDRLSYYVHEHTLTNSHFWRAESNHRCESEVSSIWDGRNVKRGHQQANGSGDGPNGWWAMSRSEGIQVTATFLVGLTTTGVLQNREGQELKNVCSQYPHWSRTRPGGWFSTAASSTATSKSR